MPSATRKTGRSGQLGDIQDIDPDTTEVTMPPSRFASLFACTFFSHQTAQLSPTVPRPWCAALQTFHAMPMVTAMSYGAITSACEKVAVNYPDLFTLYLCFFFSVTGNWKHPGLKAQIADGFRSHF